jgi:TldD protein
MGQQVAAKGVTVIDDGTIPDRRGSLSFDDEGTPTGRTTLIEDGVLTGYMQDRQNARLMGERVASKGVTVVDDGTIEGRRGSLSVDDEGTPSGYNVLIEDGILVGYMQDRQNARLMGMKATGNGRRQSYAHQPMPRMTNTYMLSGDKSPEEMISSVKKGLYAVSFGGGQVDITSGKFVFGCTEAYMIEDGKIGAPVTGAMLIGNGPEAMQRISMVGNDSALDTGIGMCGKAGQSVPVGVGQPHLLMNAMTVGGTQA